MREGIGDAGKGENMLTTAFRTCIMVLLLFTISYATWASEEQIQGKQVILTTVDGVEIRAFQIVTGKDTMLIYCHRLLSSKGSFDLDGFGGVFLREFDVLALDFRGHRQSGRVSNCGGDAVLDLRTAIQYARETGHRKIVLLGVGMGGVVAIREAALFGNADAVVAVSPCGQPDKLKPWWWNLATDIALTTDYGRIPIRILSSARISGRYWTGSLPYLVDRVSPAALLLIHGEGDRYLNREQVQMLYDDAKTPKKLLVLPRSGHAEGLLDKPTAELIVVWLKEVLTSQSPTVTTDSPPSISISSIDIHGDIVLPEKMIRNAVRAAVDGASDLGEQLAYIKKEVEFLHSSRGYTLSHVLRVQLSAGGKLSLEIAAGQIDQLVVGGNRRIPSEQVRQTLQIAEGHYYNAWEVEAAVKRLNQFPILANVENQLKQDANGSTVEILIKEHRPWSLGIVTQFTDFDQFGGLRFSLNEHRPRAWRGNGQMLLGFQHQDVLYRANIEKGWFRQEALSIGFGFEQFIRSWDKLDYYFERQEAQERGGFVNTAYRLTDNATIHLELSRERSDPLEDDEAPPVDSGFINTLAARLANRGRFLRRGEFFFNWRSQIFAETTTTRLHGDYDYTVLQLNAYPQLILSPEQTLNFGLHWGYSWGGVPQQKLFSLGGDATLPGYDDDAFIGEHVYLLRMRYDLNWGKWLGETSRLTPSGVSLLFDAGDVFMKDKPLELETPRLELGVELNYASTIRLGFVKSLGKERDASYFYFGWHPHLIRPRL